MSAEAVDIQAQTEGRVLAWLVHQCPNFYYLPSQCYDQIFTHWDDGTWNSPAYWLARGFRVVALCPCDDAEATHWVVNDSYGVFSRESAEAAARNGKSVKAMRVATRS